MPEPQETKPPEAASPPRKKGRLGCLSIAILALIVFVIGFLAGPIGQGMFKGVHLPEWLSVDKPAPELPAEVVFHLFGFPITNSIIATWLTMGLLIVFSILVTRRLKEVPGRWQAVLEFIVGSLLNFCNNIAGQKNGRRFFPVVATIFLFVIFNSWLGLLPVFGSIFVEAEGHEVHFLRAANTDINTPMAIALMSFVFVLYFGMKTLGIGFWKQYFNFGKFFGGFGKLFTGKIGAGFSGIILGVIDIFIGLVEFLSLLVRNVSFTLRLFGNMTAGEILLLMVTFLVPYLAALPFYGLELIVGFVQALIFSSLTLIFFTMAVTSHEHGEEKHH